MLRVLRKLGLLKYLNFDIRSNGQHLPVVSGVGLTEFLYPSEPWMADLLAKLLPQVKGCFIDVGVNIGQTLLKVRSLSEIEYIGFEPNPHCVSYLSHLIKANHFKNVSIYPVGLSEKSAVLELDFYSESLVDSSASIVGNFRGGSISKNYVPVFKFSDIIIDNKVGLVKIDVEGGELEVLKGMQEMISEQRPMIVIEILPCYSIGSDRHKRQLEIEDIVKTLDYSINRIEKPGISRVGEFGVHSDVSQSDYLLIPKGKPTPLLSLS